MEAWHWMLIGIGGTLAELVIPALVLVWFGLAGLILAVLVYLFPGMELEVQLGLWAFFSVVMMAAWFGYFRRKRDKSLMGRASAQIIGEVGLVAEAVAPFKKGRVRFQKPLMGSDNWPCIGEEDLSPGTRVKVVGVEGNLLRVEQTQPSNATKQEES